MAVKTYDNEPTPPFINVMGQAGKPVTLNYTPASEAPNIEDDADSDTNTTTTKTDPSASTGQNNATSPIKANAFAQKVYGGMPYGQQAQMQNETYLKERDDAMLQKAQEYNQYRDNAEANNKFIHQNGNGVSGVQPILSQEEYMSLNPTQTKAQPFGVTGSRKPGDSPVIKDTRSDFEKFRASLYDEDKIRRDSNRRAKIMAIGDALRHIGNLYYTTQGATPQEYGNENPAMKERLTYEQGYLQRNAEAQKRYATELARQKQEADAARANALAGSKIAYQDAQTQKTIQAIGIQAEKYPYELQETIAKAAKYMAEGEKAKYDTEISRLKALNTPEALALANELQHAKIKTTQQQGAAAAQRAANDSRRTSAYVAHQSAQTQKTLKEINESGDSFPVWENGRYNSGKSIVIPKGKGDAIVNSLSEYAKKQGWVKDVQKMDADGNTYTSKAKKEDVLQAIREHASDPQVQRVLRQHGKETKSNDEYVL